VTTTSLPKTFVKHCGGIEPFSIGFFLSEKEADEKRASLGTATSLHYPSIVLIHSADPEGRVLRRPEALITLMKATK
jgi:hypothetical protein